MWFFELINSRSIAQALFVLSIVAALGMGLGNLKFRGIGLGIAGVLFAGIAFGHFGISIDHGILEFVREFGLVVFVFTIGMEVGPGFFASLRRQGLQLNILAASIVFLGAALTLMMSFVLDIDMAAAVGIFTGATTNTPSLGAAGEALRSLSEVESTRYSLPGLGYAVAYPFGVIGIIITMLAMRWIFRINLAAEAKSYQQEQKGLHKPLQRLTVQVSNRNLDGLTIDEIPGTKQLNVVISRVKRKQQGEIQTAHSATPIHLDDELLVVGTAEDLGQFQIIVGEPSTTDLLEAAGAVKFRRAMVTNQSALAKTFNELGLSSHYGVTVTRVKRAGIEMTAGADLKLQFGDIVQIVGDEKGLEGATNVLGDSLKELDRTHFVTIFIGIAMGVILGSYGLQLDAMPAPLKLGLAGGPLLVAILLSSFGHLGPLVLHMPSNANTALREMGIVLFLACVGLKAGENFIETLVRGDGLMWMAAGIVITVTPLIIAAIVARAVFKMNFLAICGLLSGSMTDPPALVFAHSIANSDAPSVAYAAVYPLTMILRILLAQIMILFFVI